MGDQVTFHALKDLEPDAVHILVACDSLGPFMIGSIRDASLSREPLSLYISHHQHCFAQEVMPADCARLRHAYGG